MSDLNFKQRLARWIWITSKKLDAGLWLSEDFSGYDPASYYGDRRPPAMKYTHLRRVNKDRYFENLILNERLNDIEHNHSEEIKTLRNKYEFELIHLKDLIQQKDMVISKFSKKGE